MWETYVFQQNLCFCRSFYESICYQAFVDHICFLESNNCYISGEQNPHRHDFFCVSSDIWHRPSFSMALGLGLRTANRIRRKHRKCLTQRILSVSSPGSKVCILRNLVVYSDTSCNRHNDVGVSVSIYLLVYRTIYLFVSLSIDLSICLSIYPSVRLCVQDNPSVYRSIFPSTLWLFNIAMGNGP
jgi:hypothetical protein